MDAVAHGGAARAAELQQSAALAVQEWADEIRGMTQDVFLLTLAWEKELKKTVARVVLWSSGWAAKQRGHTIRATVQKQPNSQALALCPLTPQAWGSELQVQRDHLRYPSILSRVAYCTSELEQPSGSGAESMCLSPTMGPTSSRNWRSFLCSGTPRSPRLPMRCV